MLLPADLSPALSLIIGAVAAGILGAIVGASGYAVVVGRRQTRRLTRLADRMTEAWTMATMDLLTGVLNRQALLARLDAELDRAARYGHQLSIILVDIDHFKRLNDTHGHVAGDQMLHAVAEVLRA